MDPDYHALAYSCAFGVLSAMVMVSDNALGCEDAAEALHFLRRARRFIAAFDAMTPGEKRTWYQIGHPLDIGEPAEQGTPLPLAV